MGIKHLHFTGEVRGKQNVSHVETETVVVFYTSNTQSVDGVFLTQASSAVESIVPSRKAAKVVVGRFITTGCGQTGSCARRHNLQSQCLRAIILGKVKTYLL